MKVSLLFAVLLAAAPAIAGPGRISQHPREGVLAELEFAQGSADLAGDLVVNEKLGRVAGWAAQNPDGVIVLSGHADRTGEPGANVQLSLRRAEAVRDQLVAAGVDPAQIVIAAYGSDGAQRPRLADNRRVTIVGTHHDADAVLSALAQTAEVVATGEAGTPTSRPTVAGR